VIAFERRASTVLFSLLRGRRDDRPFLLPANACPILAITLLKAGVPFELVDISRSTLCMDSDAALERVRRNRGRYGGLIYVRNYGALLDADQFFVEFKREAPDVLIVDDRCLCPPEVLERVPEAIDVVLYSTGYAKYVDLGWGGYGIANDAVEYRTSHDSFDAGALELLTSRYKIALAAGVRFVYRDTPWLERDPPPVDWEDYVASVRAESAQSASVKRSINAIYKAQIPAELQLPEQFQNWRFNLLVENAAEALKSIAAAGLFASNHYASLSGIFSEEPAPLARNLHRHVVNLFNDRYFDSDRAEELVSVIRRVAKSASEHDLVTTCG